MTQQQERLVVMAITMVMGTGMERVTTTDQCQGVVMMLLLEPTTVSSSHRTGQTYTD